MSCKEANINSKLEKKLLEYSEAHSVTNKSEFIKAVEDIVDSEVAKSEKEMDPEIIDAGITLLLELDNVDMGALEERNQALTYKIIAEYSDKDKKTVQRKFVSFKKLLPLVAVIAILLSITVAAQSFEYDILSMTSEFFKSLTRGIYYQDENSCIIISNTEKQYFSVEKMIKDEGFSDLLFPDNLTFSDVGISVSDYGDHRIIGIIYNTNHGNIVYTVYYPTPYVIPDITPQRINEYDVYISEHNGLIQANIFIKDISYTIKSDSIEAIQYFISQLEAR